MRVIKEKILLSIFSCFEDTNNMQTKVSYLSDLRFNLETWKRELRFHFNEMDTFEEKLEEIAGREFDKRATIPLEHFQNKILLYPIYFLSVREQLRQ